MATKECVSVINLLLHGQIAFGTLLQPIVNYFRTYKACLPFSIITVMGSLKGHISVSVAANIPSM